MRTHLLAAALFTLVVSPLAAQESYRFRVSIATVGEGRQAINPRETVTIDPADERQREPVLLFVKHEPKHGWIATFTSCTKGPLTACEAAVTSWRSAAQFRDAALPPVEEQKFDIGLSPNEGSTARARCLRATCSIRWAKAGDETWDSATLAYGESKDVPLPGDVEVLSP